MNDEKIGKLERAGVDFQTGLNRFMKNVDLYEKFLNKFPVDPCMDQIRAAFQNNDLDEAFRAAHTLTGVAGNLSFIRLHHAVFGMTEALRTGDFAYGLECLPGVEMAYDEVMKALVEE